MIPIRFALGVLLFVIVSASACDDIVRPTNKPIIALSGDLTFGDVPISKTETRTLTIANGGTAPLTVSSISYPRGFSGDFASGTIAAGSKHGVKVMFAPTAAGKYDGTITVNGDQAEGTNTMAVSSGAGVSVPPPPPPQSS